MVPPRDHGERVIKSPSNLDTTSLTPHFPCRGVFGGSTSSFKSLKRTSIAPPEWICKPKTPRREIFASSTSTHSWPLRYVFIWLPRAMMTYSFQSSTLTTFSPALLSDNTPRPLSSYSLPHQ